MTLLNMLPFDTQVSGIIPLMTSYDFFHSTEFYVILTVVAAAVVALCARPGRRGEARQLFATAILSSPVECVGEETHIEIVCREDGGVALVRRGLEHVYLSGNVALAIEITGFDVVMRERITAGSPADGTATEAVFLLDFFAKEWYHVRYEAAPGGRMAAFSLHVRPGLRTSHALKM